MLGAQGRNARTAGNPYILQGRGTEQNPSPQARSGQCPHVPKFSLEEEEEGETVGLGECFFRHRWEHPEAERKTMSGWAADAKPSNRPPSRVHIRIKGEYRLKENLDGLRPEDMTNPDLSEPSDTELLQTGPICLVPQCDEDRKRTSHKSSVSQEKRDMLSSTMLAAQGYAIPVTINKRKKVVQRNGSRPPTARIEDQREPINFSAFSRAAGKKPPASQDGPRTRTTSSLYRKGTTNPAVPLKSSLDPDFLSLFAKTDYSLRF